MVKFSLTLCLMTFLVPGIQIQLSFPSQPHFLLFSVGVPGRPVSLSQNLALNYVHFTFVLVILGLPGLQWNRTSAFCCCCCFSSQLRQSHKILTEHLLFVRQHSSPGDAKVIKTPPSFKTTSELGTLTLVLGLNGLFILQSTSCPMPFSIVNTPPEATENSLWIPKS